MFVISELGREEPGRKPRPSDADSDPVARLNEAEQMISRLAVLATQDELTGVLRRGAGTTQMAKEINRALRSAEPRLVVAFLDIDGLKQINDTRGHEAGDELIRVVASSLRRRFRSYDHVIRWGGDEFLCVLPEVDEALARVALAEVVRTVVSETGHGFSFGVATVQPGDSVETLVGRADAELYAMRGRRRE